MLQIHIRMDNFSGSGFEGEDKKLATMKPMLKNKAMNRNIIDKYSDKKL